MNQSHTAAPKLFDHRHAAMQREYIEARESEGYVLYGTEVPYNHGRGFIDVVVSRTDHRRKEVTWLVAELKTSLHNLGETIRQIHRAERFFFESNPVRGTPGYTSIRRFPLVVWASEQNWRQCSNYWQLLAGIQVEFFHPEHRHATHAWNMYEIAKAIAQASQPRPTSRQHGVPAPLGRTSMAPGQYGRN